MAGASIETTLEPNRTAVDVGAGLAQATVLPVRRAPARPTLGLAWPPDRPGSPGNSGRSGYRVSARLLCRIAATCQALGHRAAGNCQQSGCQQGQAHAHAETDGGIQLSSSSGSADFAGQPVERVVNGLSDASFRLAVNLYGAPALTLPEFASYQQDLIVGASLRVFAPVGGQYDQPGR
jgi:hypothetical protein